jgi:hypothetical protein
MAAAGLSSIQAALAITKTISDARNTSNLLSVKLELQGFLLEAQEAQAALVAEKRQLEERVRALETWDEEKQRYELQTAGHSEGFVYGLKAEAQGSEPDHKLCAHCYEHGKKRLLQPHTIPEGRAQVLMCGDCKEQILVRGVAETRVFAPGARPPPRSGGR